MADRADVCPFLRWVRAPRVPRSLCRHREPLGSGLQEEPLAPTFFGRPSNLSVLRAASLASLRRVPGYRGHALHSLPANRDPETRPLIPVSAKAVWIPEKP